MDMEPPVSLSGGGSIGSSVGGGSYVVQSLQNEQAVIRRAGRQAIRQFLESHNCFAVLRASGKVVVFDVRIPIQLAFYALVEHDMLAAPLWDASKCQFVGLLTVTDFIDILREYRGEARREVASLAVRSIAEVGCTLRTFRGADSSCTLRQACEMLLSSSDDCDEFLPVVFAEDMRVLACITFTTILEHLVKHFREQRRLFDDGIQDLNIGRYHDVVSVFPHQTVATALELMHRHRLSALPVVEPLADSNTSQPARNKVVGVYSRSDITFLTKALDAEDAIRNLDMTVGEILLQHQAAQRDAIVTTPDALRTCSPNHTLQAIFESFAQHRFNRLYVVDPMDDALIGTVSARDLVSYFLRTDHPTEDP